VQIVVTANSSLQVDLGFVRRAELEKWTAPKDLD
jgi:hypothetical protein